jgi:hypothetical protein
MPLYLHPDSDTFPKLLRTTGGTDSGLAGSEDCCCPDTGGCDYPPSGASVSVSGWGGDTSGHCPFEEPSTGFYDYEVTYSSINGSYGMDDLNPTGGLCGGFPQARANLGSSDGFGTPDDYGDTGILVERTFTDFGEDAGTYEFELYLFAVEMFWGCGLDNSCDPPKITFCYGPTRFVFVGWESADGGPFTLASPFDPFGCLDVGADCDDSCDCESCADGGYNTVNWTCPSAFSLCNIVAAATDCDGMDIDIAAGFTGTASVTP